MQVRVGTSLVAAGASVSLLAGAASQAGLRVARNPSDPYGDANIGLGIALLGGSALSLAVGVPAAVGAQFLHGPARAIGTIAALTGVALGGHVAYTGYRNASQG